MPDWSGLDGTDTASRYLAQARETHGLSPSYEVLCLKIAGDGELLSRLDKLPAPKRQPNLLLGAVRFLGGPVDGYRSFRAFVLSRWDDLAATMRARRTQTNEPRRCTAYLPVLAALPQPVALLEVGTSAGLCLYPDRYAYSYVSARGDHRVGDGPVELRCVLTGDAPLPDRLPDVVWRRGLDLHPLDVRDDEDVRWLESLVWPEQTERFEILRGAVRIARADPPRIITGDLLTDLPAIAEDAPRDETLVVFHSAVLAYVPAADRPRFAAQIEELARIRPVVWLANEAPGVAIGPERFTDGPPRFVLTRDRTPLARSGPHGQSLDWL